MQLPESFILKMQDLLGDEFPSFLHSLEEPSQKGITVNFSKISKNNFEKIADFKLSPVPLVNNGYFVENFKFGEHILNHLGIIYSQEPSAMYPVELLDIEKGDFVLDLCASPGGKSIQILEKLDGTGFLLSNEIVYSRAKLLYENLNKMGFKNFAISCNSPKDFENINIKFDKIIVDAPCGGEGMIRKNNFDMSSYKQSNIETNAKRQLEILNSIKHLLRDGGKIVYSTCTYDRRENEGVIENFLENNLDFEIIGNKDFEKIASTGISDNKEIAQSSYRRYPHKHKGEGQFMVLMQKLGNEEIENTNRLPNTFSILYRNSLKDFERNFTSIANIKDLNIAKRNNSYFALPENYPNLEKLNILTIGCLIGTQEKTFKISHQFYRTYSKLFLNKVDLDLENAIKYLKGEELDCDRKNGIVVVTHKNIPLGGGKIANEKLKNYYPKELRI